MKKTKIAMLTAVSLTLGHAAGILAGCGTAERMSASTMNLSKNYENEADQQRGIADAETKEAFQRTYMDFCIRLLRENMEDGKNIMVSPVSVMMALTMAENGAAGETKAEMDSVLYQGLFQEKAKEGLISWTKELPDAPNAHFSMANSIWLRDSSESFQPEEDFLRKNAVDYGAEVYAAPFSQETLRDLNQWVEYETDGMIKAVLDEIREEAVMYLVNAAAFDAEWKNKYESNQVRETSFFNEDGSENTVTMMYSEESRFLKGEHTAGFIRPYKEGYSFAAFLPEEGMSLEDYAEQTNGEKILLMLSGAENIPVSAGLPQFEAETSLELKNILIHMGMPQAFDEQMADFSKMGSSLQGNIFISRVIHKTYINVDDAGTKAGAATVVEMVCESAMEENEQVTVILNRPFIYAIVDNESNLPVFIGTVESLGKG